MADPMAPIRAEIMAQPPAERLEYALDLLAFYLDPAPEFYSACAALGLKLPRREMAMLYALDARRGLIVSTNSLATADALECSPDDLHPPHKVSACISHMRAELKARRLPVVIETHSGIGYRLAAPADFRFETILPDLQAARLAAQ